MLKMMTYSEANVVLGSSLSPNNYCICKKTALENGADPDLIARYIPTSENAGGSSSKNANGHAYVDLGLPSGILWATLNIGASSPTSNGLYFAWGETTGYGTGSAGHFTWGGYRFGGSFISQPNKYNDTDGKTTLDIEDDAARANWGGDWHIPTEEQYQELISHCVFYTDGNCMVGRSTANGNLIYFPFCSRIYDGQYKTDETTMGYYLVADLAGKYDKINNYTASVSDSFSEISMFSYPRCQGNNVRAILGGEKVQDTYQLNRLVPAAAVSVHTVTYTIRFLDWDNTVLKTEYVVAGSNPTPPSNPTRSGYTFSGWSPSIGAANQNQDYTATYSYNGGGGEEPPTPTTYYTITWYDSLDSSWSATSSVAEGSTPYHSAPSHSGYDFSGWSPTPVAAYSDTSYTAQYTESTPVEPEPEYAIYCEGVADGGTVYVDVHLTSLSISWDGPTPRDLQWDVRGSGPGQAQAGYSSWGSGYLNNLDFTSTTTIQSGASVGYTVYAIHPSSGGSTSISGSWEVRVVESH